MSGPLLRVRGVSKRFGGLWAVKRVSFELNESERLGIIGPNGSGKTTLVNLITGELRCDEGSIEAFGRDIGGLSPHEVVKLGLARTYQGTRVFPYLTVFENALIGASAEPDQRVAYERTVEALLFTGLLGYSLFPASVLTPFQLKLLEFARALAARPHVLIMDEPFAGLSAIEVSALRSLIEYFNRTKELAFIIVEHRFRFLAGLVSKVLVLSEGEKVFEGPLEEALKNELVRRIYLGVE